MEQFITETPAATIIFLFTVITSIYAFSNPEVLHKLMLNPYSITRGKRVYTIITSGLIHKDWGHLIMNMFTYFFFAFQLEKIFVSYSSWGHLQFALLYVVSLVLSDMGTIIKHKNDSWYNSLGASGAVCAVLFSFILFYPMTTIYVLVIPLRAVIYGFLFLGYCMYASKQSRDSINHDAHFFGAISGLLITIILYPGIIPAFISQIKAG